MYVAGIDAHTTYLVCAIVSKATGELVQKPVRIPNAKVARLLELLARYQPLEVVVETCPSWPWLYELVQAQGYGFVLAHAKQLRAIAEANYKRDEIDAELLARMRLAGCIPTVSPKPRAAREQATLVRHRARLQRLRTSAANRIHAELHAVGLTLGRGRLLTQAGRQWVRTDAWPHLGPEQRLVIQTQFAVIRGLTKLRTRLDHRIAEVGATLPAVRLLQTVPGIGPYRALVIATEVLPITRFVRPAQLVSYAGLAPQTRQSGQRPVRHGPIPAGANRWLRGALVRAVVSHVQCQPDSWLTHYYTAHKQRLGWPTARIATARKLTRALHAMLRTGEVWRPAGPIEQPTSGETSELPKTHVGPTTCSL